MRRTSSKRLAVAASALFAAGWAAFAGAPSARGDFIISAFNMGVQVYGGNSWQVWVIGATNNGLNGTGSGIDGIDATITTTGSPLGVDIEKVSGTGSNTVYHANVDGQSNDANGIDAGGQPLFGDVVGGTFVGIGTGAFNTDIANHPTTASAPSSNPFVFANGHSAVTTGKLSTLDPAFENATLPVSVNAGNINNGTVQSLEVIASINDPGVNATAGPIPFANVVLPLNQTFSISGTIAPDSSGHGAVAFGPTVQPAVPEPTAIALTAFAAGGLLKRRRNARM